MAGKELTPQNVTTHSADRSTTMRRIEVPTSDFGKLIKQSLGVKQDSEFELIYDGMYLVGCRVVEVVDNRKVRKA